MLSLDRHALPEAVANREWFRAAAARKTSLTVDERRRFNRGLVLPHPQQAAVAEDLKAIREHNATHPTRRRALGLDGDYGCGKSTLAAELLLDVCETSWKQHGMSISDSQVVSEVIPGFAVGASERSSVGRLAGDCPDLVQPGFYADASSSGEADFAFAICNALGRSVPDRTATLMLTWARRQCERSLTEVGVVDDVNMLVTSTRRVHMTQFGKRLISRLPVTLVFVGKGLDQTPLMRPTSKDKADHDAALQTSRRTTAIALDPIPYTEQGARQFLDLLQECAGMFALAPDPWKQVTPAAVERLHRATGGSVGRLFEVLTWAAAEATGRTERFTPAGLQAAARKVGL